MTSCSEIASSDTETITETRGRTRHHHRQDSAPAPNPARPLRLGLYHHGCRSLQRHVLLLGTALAWDGPSHAPGKMAPTPARGPWSPTSRAEAQHTVCDPHPTPQPSREEMACSFHHVINMPSKGCFVGLPEDNTNSSYKSVLSVDRVQLKNW